jgi:hypothetical protein
VPPAADPVAVDRFAQAPRRRRRGHAGFTLFYDEDTRSGPLMTPAEVLALVPQPEYVLYE